jgi:hypothetical protein
MSAGSCASGFHADRHRTRRSRVGLLGASAVFFLESEPAQGASTGLSSNTRDGMRSDHVAHQPKRLICPVRVEMHVVPRWTADAGGFQRVWWHLVVSEAGKTGQRLDDGVVEHPGESPIEEHDADPAPT